MVHFSVWKNTQPNLPPGFIMSRTVMARNKHSMAPCTTAHPCFFPSCGKVKSMRLSCCQVLLLHAARSLATRMCRTRNLARLFFSPPPATGTCMHLVRLWQVFAMAIFSCLQQQQTTICCRATAAIVWHCTWHGTRIYIGLHDIPGWFRWHQHCFISARSVPNPGPTPGLRGFHHQICRYHRPCWEAHWIKVVKGLLLAAICKSSQHATATGRGAPHVGSHKKSIDQLRDVQTWKWNYRLPASHHSPCAWEIWPFCFSLFSNYKSLPKMGFDFFLPHFQPGK